MDRGIWATWYDLPQEGKDEYLTWLHTAHIPAMLARPGYLWAAHVQNIMTPEREQNLNRHLIHTLVAAGGQKPHSCPPFPWVGGADLATSIMARAAMPPVSESSPCRGGA